jgi:hypothetical protein
VIVISASLQTWGISSDREGTMGFLWDLLQEQDLRDVRERLDRLQRESDPRLARELAEVALELRVRLAALVRLLIAKGLITAEEYAAQLAEARSGEGKSA